MGWLHGDNVAAYYINLDSRPDRNAHMQTEMRPFQVHVSPGLIVERLSATAMPGRGALGCAHSQIRCLEQGLATGKPFIAVFEDDFQWEMPPEDAIRRLESASADFGLLTSCYFYPTVQINFDDFLKKSDGVSALATNVQMACGYFVERSFAADKLLPCFRAAVSRFRAGHNLHTAAIDVMWKPLQTAANKFRVMVPRLGRQRVDKSDIINSSIDYGGSCIYVAVCHRSSCDTSITASPMCDRLPFIGLRIDCFNQYDATSTHTLVQVLQHVRRNYPVVHHIFLHFALPNQETETLDCSKMFRLWHNSSSLRYRPCSLTADFANGHRDCLIAASLADLVLSSSREQREALPQHSLLLPALCNQFNRYWKKAWDSSWIKSTAVPPPSQQPPSSTAIPPSQQPPSFTAIPSQTPSAPLEPRIVHCVEKTSNQMVPKAGVADRFWTFAEMSATSCAHVPLACVRAMRSPPTVHMSSH